MVTHKDRFIRLSYDWFERFCKKFNTTIVVVKKGYCFNTPCVLLQAAKGFVSIKTDRKG